MPSLVRRLLTPLPSWATIRDALRVSDDRLVRDFADALFATPVRRSNMPLALATALKLVAKYEAEMKAFGSRRMREWHWTPAHRKVIATEMLNVGWTLESLRKRVQTKSEIALIEASYKAHPSHWIGMEKIAAFPLNEWVVQFALYEALSGIELSQGDKSRLHRIVYACDRRFHAVIQPGTFLEP